MRPRRHAVVLAGLAALGLTFALILFAEHGYRAAVGALQLFFRVVLPSLLPFFILSEVLLAFGVVHFLGVLFEPLMRPVFNVPGVGSFVFSMGLAAGYPMDAVLTAKFRKQGLCTRVEAERLLAFTNTADPLFLFGAVAVGMFHRPDLGVTLAVAHYAAALVVGMGFRFYGWREPASPPAAVQARGALLSRAVEAMYQARVADGRPVGKVLVDAIEESVRTLAMIMSFIVLFSVLVRVLEHTGVVSLLTTPLVVVLRLLGFRPDLAPALLRGFMEIDLGAAAAAGAAAPLAQRIAVVSAIVAWSGLSVHGQVASVVADTDIRMRPYVLARLAHAVAAGVFTALLWR